MLDMECFEGVVGPTWVTFWGQLGSSLGAFGGSLGRLGSLLDRLGCLLGSGGGPRRGEPELLGVSWAVLGASWGHLGAPRGHLGVFLGANMVP